MFPLVLQLHGPFSMSTRSVSFLVLGELGDQRWCLCSRRTPANRSLLDLEEVGSGDRLLEVLIRYCDVFTDLNLNKRQYYDIKTQT